MKLSKKLAYSKINLGLDVLFKREDGFHEINTVFAKTSLCDELIFEASEKYTLTVISDFEIEESDNLVSKAYNLFSNEIGNQPKIKITLIKNIPIGAGLGGGSSDAATTLLGLNELNNNILSTEQLIQLAVKLGSDVPFFICSGLAHGKGRGEKLDYFQVELPFKILLINPGIHISTPWAYKNLNRNLDFVNPTDMKKCVIDFSNRAEFIKLKNDFEDIVFKEYPLIREIKESLYQNNAFFSLMSGSGSTVFGLFKNEIEAAKAQAQFPDYFTYIADFIKE